MTGALRIGPGLAVAADRTQDEARVRRDQRVPADAEPIHHAGSKTFDDDVRTGRHPQEGLATGRRLQVERERSLVAIHGEEAP